MQIRRLHRVLGPLAASVALLASGLTAVTAVTVITVFTAPVAAADPSPAPSTTRQLITVNAPTSSSTTATVTAWQRGQDGIWRVAIGPTGGRVGGTGIGRASEGSRHTPAGTLGLTQAFGRAPNPGTRMPYFRTDTLDWWDENPSSPTYNLHVRQVGSPGGASENLYNSGSVYDYVVNMNYNAARVPGAGSAFFLHVSNGRPTAGCVSVSRATMVAILKWLDPAQHPYISIKVGAAWKPPVPGHPVGRSDSMTPSARAQLTVTGWAVDPKAATAKIKVIVTGPAGTQTVIGATGVSRPDVARAYSWAGPRTGYRITTRSEGIGVNTVCAYVVSGTTSTVLACHHVLIQNAFGRLDGLSVSGSTITAVGWALNPAQRNARVPIRIRDVGPVSQVLGDFRAAAYRPDVARAHPGYDSNHGFRIAIPVKSKGSHRICAIALPQYGNYSGPTIGCAAIVVR